MYGRGIKSIPGHQVEKCEIRTEILQVTNTISNLNSKKGASAFKFLTGTRITVTARRAGYPGYVYHDEPEVLGTPGTRRRREPDAGSPGVARPAKPLTRSVNRLLTDDHDPRSPAPPADSNSRRIMIPCDYAHTRVHGVFGCPATVRSRTTSTRVPGRVPGDLIIIGADSSGLYAAYSGYTGTRAAPFVGG
eukprot:2166009-Rhodomonas_salina.2